MSSKKVEDVHAKLLKKLLSDSGLVCIRSAPSSLESSTLSGESDEGEFRAEEEELAPETLLVEETKLPVEEELAEEQPDIFPTPSLRRVLPDKVRRIELQNRVHVLPEVFRTDIDPQAIPKIASTAPQKYIDILAEIVGCEMYKRSLAEFWFLDTLANLLRRAQEDELDRPTQAVLILWFCEWMKEMQHFDAADRQRMLRRFQDNMLSAARFIGDEQRLPTPKDAGVHYKAPEPEDLRSTLNVEIPPSLADQPVLSVTFKGAYECSLRDLTKIIHYIYDLFSTDYQYDLVRSVFTFTTDYSLIDAPYQIQTPKRMYTVLKAKANERGKSAKKDGKAKGKKKESEPTEDYLNLMALKAKEERDLDELEEKDREAWNRKSRVLPLSFAATEEFFNKYWPPPEPEPEKEAPPPTTEPKKGKGKGK